MDPCHDLQANQPVRIPDEHWTGPRIKNVKASSPYIADPALRPSRGPAGQQEYGPAAL